MSDAVESPAVAPRTPIWVPWTAGLLGAATVALAEPGSLELLETLEGWGAGSAGMPWLRVRATALALAGMVPLGTMALRLGLAVALLHAALAALVASRTWRAHAAEDGGALLGGAAVLAGALAVSFPVAFEAVRAPSAAALGVIVLLLALSARGWAAAFAAGLLLAVDPVAFLIGAAPLWLSLRRAPRRELGMAFAAGVAPALLLLVPGRALYTLPVTVPGGWATLRVALGAIGQVGWAAAVLAAVGLLLSIRRGGATRETALQRLMVLLPAALAALLAGPVAGRSALVLLGALIAECVAAAVWLGGSMLIARKIPLARLSIAFVLMLLLAWPLSRLDAAVGHPIDARAANAAVEQQLFSSLPARGIVLMRDDEAERAVLAAQTTASLSATVDVFPLRHVDSARARRALQVDPALLPIARETLLGGAPSELVLSNLASMRPTFVEVTPSVPKPIAKHLLPAGAWLRFDAEPRAASDRALALDREAKFRKLAAERSALSADHGRRLVRATRRVAIALAATGEKDSASRGIDALRAVAGDEPLVSLLLRKSVLQGITLDLGDIVIEE